MDWTTISTRMKRKEIFILNVLGYLLSKSNQCLDLVVSKKKRWMSRFPIDLISPF
jgi:hypothetical protein